MKPIIILVHGMGTHNKGEISAQFVSGINETTKDFSIEGFDIAKEVTLVEFHYNDIFDDIRKKLSENADAIKNNGFGALSGAGVAASIINSLTGFESSFKDDTMFTSHWLDVILYGTTHFGELIRVKFATLLNDQIRDAMGSEIHIICHSLGTAVVHDTLAKIFRKDADIADNIPDLIQGAFNVNTLWTFSNVSRMVNLLNKLEDPMDSPVTTGPNGCTDYFINVRHKLDPFTWYKTYNRAMDSSVTFENDIVRKWNTHDFAEYVGAPLVTQRLLNTFTTRTTQNAPEKLAACIAKYNEKSINEAVEGLTKAAADLQGRPIASFKDAFDSINSVMVTVQKFKEDFEK